MSTGSNRFRFILALVAVTFVGLTVRIYSQELKVK